jgi:uncharacterized phage protein (TIGR01671 family)
MRTIKFRGKRIDNGEWVYGNLYKLPLESGNVCMILTTDNIHEDNSIEPQYHLAFTLWKDLFVVDSSTIGQFTGLFDKNGKEIYEGDIIQGEYKSKHLIRYTEEDARFTATLAEYVGDKFSERCNTGDVTQKWINEFNKVVIGNIHDNPELIKD